WLRGCGSSSNGARRRWQQRFPGKWERRGEPWRVGYSSSGTRASDDYREETLDRLEAEQREFRHVLDRSRPAKDRPEFDQCMAERKNRLTDPAPDRPDEAPSAQT